MYIAMWLELPNIRSYVHKYLTKHIIIHCVYFSCCRSPADDEFHGEGDNSCGWNMEALRKQTFLANADFVYASFKAEVCI